MEPVDNGRARIAHQDDYLLISIPSLKSFWRYAIGTLSLVGGMVYLILVFIIGGLSGGGMLLLSMFVWSPVMFLTFEAGRYVAWLLFGKEIFQIDSQGVLFGKSIISNRNLLNLDPTHVKNLRFNHSPNYLQFLGRGKGRILFDYGMKTYSFGYSLDESEARFLLNYLEKNLKLYKLFQ